MQYYFIFIDYNILIKLIKTHINYLNISFLDQKINFLSLIIAKNKLKVIQLLYYLDILNILKYCLSLIKYF